MYGFTTHKVSAQITTLNSLTSINTMHACSGKISNIDSVTVSGSNLIGDITFTATANLEVSIAYGGTYTSSLILPLSFDSVALTTIYVRITSVATTSGIETISISSPNTTIKSIIIDCKVDVPSTSITTTTSCDSLWWNGVKYINSGTYLDTIPNVAGCDSIMTLNLTIINSSSSTTTQTACDSLWWNGVKYTASGTYTWRATNAMGCDSIAILNLTINQSASTTFTTSACGSYTWALNNKVYLSSNQTDTVHLTTVNGCDSLITLDLTILSNITDVHINNVGAYCGDTATTQLSTNINYTYGNVSYEWIRLGYNEDSWQTVSTDSVVNVSDVYPAQYVVKTVIAGCGTFYSNQQTVMPVKTPTVSLTSSPIISICNNNVVNFIASSADSGVNNYAFYNASSVVQNGASLTYNTPILSTANNGAIYTVEATNLKPTFDGNITENFWGAPLAVSTFGPSPSFGAGHELNAVYARADADNVYLAIAGNVQNNNRIMVFIDSKSGGYNNGNYGRTGLANNGIKNFNSGSIFDPGFNADYCLGIGTDVTRSQFYMDLFTLGGTAAGGGGSNNYIGSNHSPASGYSIGANPANISQTQGFEIAIPKSAIGYTNGDIRIFVLYSADNGFLSNQFLTRANVGANNYGNGIINFALATPSPIDIPVGSLQNSCKTIVATAVTVKPNLTSTTTISACDSFAWNGVIYQTSGTYTFISNGSNGCDSIATLALTINHPTTSTTTTSACDSLVWNGTTYKVDGTYTFNATSFVGCDSVATLKLTITTPTSSYDSKKICSELLPYNWNGVSCYGNGAWTATIPNAAGCDSVATLALTVEYNPAKPNITVATNAITAPISDVPYKCDEVQYAYFGYKWTYTGSGVTINSLTFKNDSITADFNATATSGYIKVYAMGNYGCDSPEDSVYVTVSPLPVVLNQFTITKEKNTVLVKWATVTEINNKNFEVQRSIDGRNFETIGTVTANGFASEYSFVDEKPFAGTNYYRLKQVDNDGKFSLSWVRTLNFKLQTLNIAVYPNPVTETLNIKVSNTEAKKVRIFNAMGKMVYQYNIHRAFYAINLASFSPGIYFVEITTNDGSKQVEKFEKK